MAAIRRPSKLVVNRYDQPAWSPDGSKLAVYGNGGIYLVNIDGTNPTRITQVSGSNDFDSDPAWSPDGSKLAFTRGINCDWNDCWGGWQVWVVNADGSNPTKLRGDYNSSPAWSPDGTKIVFSNDQAVGGDLFVMKSDGSGFENITNTSDVLENTPSWQAVQSPPSPVNPVDEAQFFIRQQYRDFLGREPEPDGLQFYLDILNRCSSVDIECIKYTRGVVSGNFFRSPEFQRKGNYVMYLYMVSIGQRPVTVAELSTKNDPALNDRPTYPEFTADLASISTPNDDPVLTEQKKNDLANNWMTRPQIVSIYGGLSNAQFVQKLIDVSGVTPANQNWVSELNAGTKTRAQVLRLFAESPEVNAKFEKQSFVTMEYFGYLRRKPEDCHDPANWGGSDPSQCGFIFHNHRFTLHPDPHVIQNIIVRGFIESPEYRSRF